MQTLKEEEKIFCQFSDEYSAEYIQNYRARIKSVWNETQMTVIVETFVNFIDSYTKAFMKADFPGDAVWVFTQLSAINDHVKTHGYRFAQEDVPLDLLNKPLLEFLKTAKGGRPLPEGLVFPYSVNSSISKPHQFILRQYYELGLPKLSGSCFTSQHYQEAYDIVNHLFSDAIQSIQKAAGEKLSYSSLVTNLKCFKAREEKSIDKSQLSTSGDSNLSNLVEGEKNVPSPSLPSAGTNIGKKEKKERGESEYRPSKKPKLASGSAKIVGNSPTIFPSSSSASSSNESPHEIRKEYQCMQIFKENGKTFCQFDDEYQKQYIQNYRARIKSVWNETQMTLIVETFVNFIDCYTKAFMKADFPGDAVWVFTQLSAINDHVKAHGYHFGQEDLSLEKLEKSLFEFLDAAKENHSPPDGLIFPYSVEDSIEKPHQFILRRYYDLRLPKLSESCYTSGHYQEAYEIVNHLLSDAIQSIQKAVVGKLSYSSAVTNLKSFKEREEKSVGKPQLSASDDSTASGVSTVISMLPSMHMEKNSIREKDSLLSEAEKNMASSNLSSAEASGGKREREESGEEGSSHSAFKKPKFTAGSAELIAKHSPIFSSSLSSSSSNEGSLVFESKGSEADADLVARTMAIASAGEIDGEVSDVQVKVSESREYVRVTEFWNNQQKEKVDEHEKDVQKGSEGYSAY